MNVLARNETPLTGQARRGGRHDDQATLPAVTDVIGDSGDSDDNDDNDDQAASIRSAAVLLTVTTLIASGINYLVNLLLARWMTPSEFGDANLIVTMMLGLTAVAVSLQFIAAQRVSALNSPTTPGGWQAQRTALSRRAWIVGGIIAVALSLSSTVIRDVSSSASAIPFVLLAVGIPFLLAQSVERGVLQGLLSFRALSSTLLVEAAARLTVAVLLVSAGFGVAGATTGITISFIASWWCGRRQVRSAAGESTAASPSTMLSTDHKTSAVATRAGQATMILLVGQILINNGDVVLAKVLFDADQAGVYSVVALVGRAIFFLSWSLVTAAFPHAAQGDEVAFAAVRRQTVRAVAAMSTVLTIAVALVAPRLAPIVFGEAYSSAATLFAPYAIATSLFAIANASASLSVARGRRTPAVLVVVGAIGQTTLLLSLANNSSEMVWLQVGAMAVLTFGILLEQSVHARSRIG